MKVAMPSHEEVVLYSQPHFGNSLTQFTMLTLSTQKYSEVGNHVTMDFGGNCRCS